MRLKSRLGLPLPLLFEDEVNNVAPGDGRCWRVAPASNGGVRSHEQQLARRLAALEDRGERGRCAVALAGIVVQRERLARANPDTPTPTHQWRRGPDLSFFEGGSRGRGVGVDGWLCP